MPCSSIPMDSTNESYGSADRRESGGRRVKNQIPDKDNSDKGKEKEHDVRVLDRDRDGGRSFALNIDGGSGHDDNDSENGASARLDDLLPSSAMGLASSSFFPGRSLKKILDGSRTDGEEGRHVEALMHLCKMLSIGTEESLSTFSVDSFVPVLVGLLNHESNSDIMLLAARALTLLCNVIPSSCAAVSLQALKKISQDHPAACLRAGALMAVLSNLDLFSTRVQQIALSTAANMCKKLPSDAADFVMEAVPLLTNLLQYHDVKVLEHASICLTRIAEVFASSPVKLDELCNHGLVTQGASLVSTSNSGSGQASLSILTYTVIHAYSFLVKPSFGSFSCD
ncbi:E3 ubiquitin-protein ligase upl3 [Sarracenia purpurea var. burkii]